MGVNAWIVTVGNYLEGGWCQISAGVTSQLEGETWQLCLGLLHFSDLVTSVTSQVFN